MAECNFIKLRRAMQNHDGEMFGEPVGEYMPLIHGHWIIVNCYDGGAKKCKCSNCKGVVKYFENSYKWCPHCGAKMDKNFFSGVSEPPASGDTVPTRKVKIFIKYFDGERERHTVTYETAKKLLSEFGTAGKNCIIFEELHEEEKTNVKKDTAVIGISNIKYLNIVEYCDEEADNETDQTDKM